ncbi:MAG: hypothetical protein AB7K24_09105 [Gemmataceae bacterium]
MHSYDGFKAHPEDMRWGLVASAILDTILCRNQALRYHTYVPNRLAAVDVAVLDHGNGDELMCVLDSRHGCLIRGFDHESKMSPHAQAEFRAWPGVLDEVPSNLLVHLKSPEFRQEETTFCIWRCREDKEWWQGEVEEPEEGEWSAHLLSHVFLDAGSYLDWACEYYNRKDIPASPVRRVYESCQADGALVRAINAKADLDAVRYSLTEMGITLA